MDATQTLSIQEALVRYGDIPLKAFLDAMIEQELMPLNLELRPVCKVIVQPEALTCQMEGKTVMRMVAA